MTNVPPPLPGSTISNHPVERPAPPPLPENNARQPQTPPPLPAASSTPAAPPPLPGGSAPAKSEPSVQVVANPESISAPVEKCEPPPFSNLATSNSGPRPPSAISRVAWIAGGMAGLAVIGAVSAYVFGKRDREPSAESAKTAVVETTAAQKETPVPSTPPPVQTAENLPAIPQAAEKSEQTTQLAPQRPQAEADKQKSELAAGSKQKQALVPAPTIPTPVPARLVQQANTGKFTLVTENTYLLNGSIQDVGQGFRAVTMVKNVDGQGRDFAPGTKSSVVRVVFNCREGLYTRDRSHFYSQPFGEGTVLWSQELRPEQAEFKPVAEAPTFRLIAPGVCG